jgi:N-acetylglucosaminyl-diphospho-decaprenol L-rhamnosyltransferase
VRVTVAVVSFNTRELLVRCLRSLEGTDADVWVIDNASSDGSADAARQAAPWAHVVDAGANLGFGAAVNAIAERTEGEWLLAANADVAFEPGALEAMLVAGRPEPVGAVAPRLLLPDGSTQHSVHPFPTVPLTLAFNLGLPRLWPKLGDELCLERYWNPERRRAVPWAIGACLLLRRRAFDEVGRFDSRQWMYAEDVDLCWRLADAGWSIRYEPTARVRHQAGAATAEAFGGRPEPIFMASTYAMLGRRRGKVRTAATAAINIAGAAARADRRWLAAHVRGVRRCSGLDGPRN